MFPENQPFIKPAFIKKVRLRCRTPKAKQRVGIPLTALSVTDHTSDVNRVNKIVWEENVM